ncbi:MAG: T9SS type A sorting domain-containing protein [Bacteroidales bacterium]|nr:T9SS type A sorting domain-containing protein [Bacteroidales bacterium]
MKNVILTTILIILSISFTRAQLPAYVPTDSLLAWFPFNGNANDISGNNNHLTNYGASLTNDRFNNYNSAYNVQAYSGLRRSAPITNGVNVTYTFWIYASTGGANIIAETNSPLTSSGFNCLIQNYIPKICTQGVAANVTNATSAIGQNTWYFITVTKQGTQFKLYINGILTSQGTSNASAFDANTYFFISAGTSNSGGFSGNIDDVGIWNRALTQTEISGLYNACNGNIITTQPTNQNLNLGSNANFITASLVNSNYQWQTNIGHLGWINTPSNSYYLGGSSNALTVNNVQLNNHLQQFRLIATLNGCEDTSNVATLVITDTCIASQNDTNHINVYDTINIYDTVIINDTNHITVNDTVLISVVDTLVIEVELNISSPVVNLIKIYPNPAKDYITIDFGDFASMSGYLLKITNVSGQIIYYTPIYQQTTQLDLSTWTGKGIYFVQILDSQFQIIETKKILLE